jgi:hypothetical protein
MYIVHKGLEKKLNRQIYSKLVKKIKPLSEYYHHKMTLGRGEQKMLKISIFVTSNELRGNNKAKNT